MQSAGGVPVALTKSELDALRSRLARADAARTYGCPVCAGAGQWCCAVDFAVSGNDYFTGCRNFADTGVLVDYFQCEGCGFLFAPAFQAFTMEDYRRFIYNQDYLLADPPFLDERPARDAASVELLLAPWGKDLRLLDYGSGPGGLTEGLRARGFRHCEAYDPVYRDGRRAEGPFDVVTCLEVIEHVADQRTLAAGLQSLLAAGGFLILSTQVQPANFGELKARWWYIEPRNGHIGIHSERSLRLLFEHEGLGTERLCQDLYLIHAGRVPGDLERRLADGRFREELCANRNPRPENGV